MYDAIVVGARCAGAPTAMHLARKGWRVLLVDRATFPRDIPHGHFIHRDGPRRLAAWGLLEGIEGHCPRVTSFTLDLGDFPLTAHNLVPDRIYAPRRSRLDHLLVEAAVEAGAELRCEVLRRSPPLRVAQMKSRTVSTIRILPSIVQTA